MTSDVGGLRGESWRPEPRRASERASSRPLPRKSGAESLVGDCIADRSAVFSCSRGGPGERAVRVVRLPAPARAALRDNPPVYLSERNGSATKLAGDLRRRPPERAPTLGGP